MKKEMVCPNCGTIGNPTTVTKGSFIMELALWLCFLVPGLIYSLRRLTTRYNNACPKCKSVMLSTDTPKGQKLMKEYQNGEVKRDFRD